MKPVEIVQFYSDLGWSVIPLKPKSKVPAIAWDKYQETKPTRQELEKWFKDGTANMGLATGKVSGVIVVDRDTYKKVGIELDSPLKVKTGGGGLHLYFKYTGALGNSVSSEHGTDIRANGGQVVLPPSMHPSGIRYEWITKPTKEILENLPELPQQVIDTLQKRNGSNFDFSNAIGASSGNRNEALKKAIPSILNKTSKENWDTEAWRLVVALNNTFSPPESERNLRQLFEYEKRFVLNNPTIGIKSPEPSNQPFSRFDPVRALGSLKQKLSWPTGITKIDDALVGGLHPEQSLLFFGEPKRGKSLLTLNILYNLARSGLPCLYFDLENGYRLNDKRLIKIHTGWGDNDLNEAINNTESQEIISKLKELPLSLVSDEELDKRYGSVSLEAIKTAIEDGVRQGYKVFAIDNLLNFPVPKTEGENSFYTRFASTINSLAVQHKIAIILVHHASIKSEKDKSATTDSFADTNSKSIRIPHISKALGSTGIPAKVQVIFSVAADPVSSKLFVWLQQQRDGPSDVRMKLDVDPKSLRIGDYVIKTPIPATVDEEICRICNTNLTWRETTRHWACPACHPELSREEETNDN